MRDIRRIVADVYAGRFALSPFETLAMVDALADLAKPENWIPIPAKFPHDDDFYPRLKDYPAGPGFMWGDMRHPWDIAALKCSEPDQRL